MDSNSEPNSLEAGQPGANGAAPAHDVADGAVGVPGWFVAIVNNNAERTAAQQLADLGHEVYVASQLQLRQRPSGRRVKVEKVLIPGCVFVRCTEAERRLIVTLPYVNRFLADRARARDGLNAPPAIIPQPQIDTLRFMLGQTDHPVSLTQAQYRPGDKVRVVRGALRGLIGEVLHGSSLHSAPSTLHSSPSTLHSSPSTEIIVRLDILGTARVALSPTDLAQAT